MRNLIILPIILAFVAGCSTTSFEVASGQNLTTRTGDFRGGSEVFRVTVRQDFTPHTFCGYTHVSHVLRGQPFNDRPEDYMDVIECGLRLKLGSR